MSETCYMVFNALEPYRVEDTRDETYHYEYGFPFTVQIGAGYFVNSITSKTGILLRTTGRQCLYSYVDSNNNHSYMYFTNGTTECKNVDPQYYGGGLMSTINFVGSGDNQTATVISHGFGFDITNVNNGHIGDYPYATGKYFKNLNAVIRNNSYDVLVNPEDLWSNHSVPYYGELSGQNYKVHRSDLLFDNGGVCSYGFSMRLPNYSNTIAPNFENHEFKNITLNDGHKRGAEVIGINVDLLGDNPDDDIIRGHDMTVASQFSTVLSPLTSSYGVLDLPLVASPKPQSKPLSDIFYRYSDISNTSVNLITSGIVMCETMEEVIDYLDNGVVPDGWTRDDDIDIDTDGESDPNPDDNIEDNPTVTPSDNSLRGTDLYIVTKDDITSFKNAFFSFDLTDAVINKFTGLYSGLENYIVSLKYFPCGVPNVSTGLSTVKVGNLVLGGDTPLTLNKINSYTTGILYSGTLQLPEYYHSILDYGSYNKAWLYLPYYGTIPIDVNILRTRTLKLVYTLDVLSGSSTIILFIGNTNAYTPMTILSCEMGCDIPLTLQNGIELGTKIVDLSTNILTATVGGAVGGGMGAMLGGASNLAHGVDLSNMTQICGRSNSLAMQSAPLYPSLLLMKPNYPKNYQGSYGNVVGKPNCTVSKLKKGLNVCINPSLQVEKATEKEYQMILSELTKGVYV